MNSEQVNVEQVNVKDMLTNIQLKQSLTYDDVLFIKKYAPEQQYKSQFNTAFSFIGLQINTLMDTLYEFIRTKQYVQMVDIIVQILNSTLKTVIIGKFMKIRGILLYKESTLHNNASLNKSIQEHDYISQEGKDRVHQEFQRYNEMIETVL